MSEPLTTILTPEQVAATRQHVCDLASGRERWRMCVPVRDDDSDTRLVALCKSHEALRAALAASEQARARETAEADAVFGHVDAGEMGA